MDEKFVIFLLKALNIFLLILIVMLLSGCVAVGPECGQSYFNGGGMTSPMAVQWWVSVPIC